MNDYIVDICEGRFLGLIPRSSSIGILSICCRKFFLIIFLLPISTPVGGTMFYSHQQRKRDPVHLWTHKQNVSNFLDFHQSDK